jgi:hypothetical protein
MLKITGNGSITTCDGITRRDFLQVGALGAIGLTMSKFAALQAMGAVAKGNDEKAAIMIFNLGAARNSRPVQADQDEESGYPDFGDFPDAREDRGQVLASAKLLSYRCRCA